MPPRLMPRGGFPLLPPPTRVNGFFASRRAIHDEKADIVSQDARGSLTTQELDISTNDPEDAYIFMLDKSVGFAMRSAMAKQTGVGQAWDPEKVSLAFFHDSQHFAHSTSPLPPNLMSAWPS